MASNGWSGRCHCCLYSRKLKWFVVNEPEKMCVKSHAVVTVTEGQVLPSTTSPHTHLPSFLMYEVRGIATLMKHLMMVTRDGLKEGGVWEQEWRRQARRRWVRAGVSSCVRACVSLRPFSACLHGHLLWENESPLKLPHNAYLQLAV